MNQESGRKKGKRMRGEKRAGRRADEEARRGRAAGNRKESSSQSISLSHTHTHYPFPSPNQPLFFLLAFADSAPCLPYCISVPSSSSSMFAADAGAARLFARRAPACAKHPLSPSLLVSRSRFRSLALTHSLPLLRVCMCASARFSAEAVLCSEVQTRAEPCLCSSGSMSASLGDARRRRRRRRQRCCICSKGRHGKSISMLPPSLASHELPLASQVYVSSPVVFSCLLVSCLVVRKSRQQQQQQRELLSPVTLSALLSRSLPASLACSSRRADRSLMLLHVRTSRDTHSHANRQTEASSQARSTRAQTHQRTKKINARSDRE